MSKKKKLRQKIAQNPKNVSFQQLRSLLEAYGFELKRVTGSHHSFTGMVASTKELLVVPLDQPIKVNICKEGFKVD